MGDHVLQCVSADAPAGHHADDGAAEEFFKRVGVDDLAIRLGFVRHIEDQDEGDAHFKKLGGRVKIALQIGGVENVDDERRFAGEDEVAGDAFVLRASAHAADEIDARQIDKIVARALVGVGARFLFHRHARPVADSLIAPGQKVEKGGLAAVRIAYYRRHAALGISHDKRSTLRMAASALRSVRVKFLTTISTGSPRGARRRIEKTAPGVSPIASSRCR